MKRNTRWYLSAAAAGALLAGAALWAARTFPAAPAAVPGFFGLAGGLLFFCAMAELLSTRDLDPARRERDREDHDERGAMIRAMARARAGDVLLWLLLFGAAYLYFYGVAFNGNGRNVLFQAGVNSVGLKLFHGFSAADNGNARIVNHFHLVAAVSADCLLYTSPSPRDTR